MPPPPIFAETIPTPGALFPRVGHTPLPMLAKELECSSWAQLFLKFIVSQPAITCAIPATSKVHHLEDKHAGHAGAAS